jgi:hypothetical protein
VLLHFKCFTSRLSLAVTPMTSFCHIVIQCASELDIGGGDGRWPDQREKLVNDQKGLAQYYVCELDYRLLHTAHCAVHVQVRTIMNELQQ